MSIKSLFNNKTTTVESAASGSKLVESKDLVLTTIQRDETFYPFIDFSSASNFAKFGSAEEYYKNSIERIHNNYPYDGSENEKLVFELSSSYLDKYLLDNRYPKTNGYANFSYGGWGTQASTADGYGLSDSTEYIYLRGGIHVAEDMTTKPLQQTFDKSVSYDAAKKRTTSLRMNIPQGLTTEFWLKKEAFDLTNTNKEVILDLWNGEISSSTNYGRFTLALSGTTSGEDTFIVTMQSGTTGFFEQPIGTATVTTSSLSNWHHYALSFVSASTGVTSRLYVDGDLNESKSLGSTGINEIGGLINGYIGALQTSPSSSNGAATALPYSGKLSASLDDFRFWKTRRTSEEIYNNWYRHVGGGTNTDDANTYLGVYYKFNEGIVGNTQIDSNVLDYSGRLVNGTWTGYASGARSVDSAFVESGLIASEEKDPIIYSTHSDVSSLKTTLMDLGKSHDGENPALLYNKVPQWIKDEDSSTGFSTKYLYQIIASYFDTLHAQITALPSLKNKVYPSSSYKALPFADRLIEEKGLVVSNLFADSNVLEAFGSRDLNKIQFEKKVTDIKNQIYTNIYNNLESIYKHKGTEGAIRNMLRCFGVDDEIIKLNIYTDKGTHYFSDAYKHTSENKKYIDFNKESHLGATLFQTSSINHSLTYISGSGTEKLEQYNALTSEISIVVPKKITFPNSGWFATPFQSASVFGMHGAASDSADYTWGASETTITPQTASIQFTMVSTGSLEHQAILQLTGGSDNALVVYADPNQALATNPSTIDHIIYTGSVGMALLGNTAAAARFRNTSYSGIDTVDGPFSVSFWFNTTTSDDNSIYTYLKLQNGGTDIISINPHTTGGDVGVTISSTTPASETETFSSLHSGIDSWKHYVFAFDLTSIASGGATVTAYQNSSQIATKTFSTLSATANALNRILISLGEGAAIQDVVVWSKTLSSSDVLKLYGNGQWVNPTTVSSSQINDWYKFGYEGDFAGAADGDAFTDFGTQPFVSSSYPPSSNRDLQVVTTTEAGRIEFHTGSNPFGAAKNDGTIRNELTAALNTVFSANFGNTTYTPIPGDGVTTTFTLKSGSAGPETVNGSVVSSSFAITANNNGAPLSSTTYDDISNFQVYLVRDEVESPTAKFVLKDYAGNFTLETPAYKQIYSNEQWNLAVRVKPVDYPIAGNVVTSSNRNYQLEFYGVNHAFDTIKNEFTLTQSLNYDTGSAYLSNAKRFYAGAHRTNFTGSVLEQTDIKIGRFDLWYDYISDNSVKLHNTDITSRGNRRSSRPSTIFGKDLSQIEVPSYELLTADWDFETISTSDASGEFIVVDVSSGSTDSRYGWMDNIIRREHRAKGFGFPVSTTNVISNEIIYSSKKELPEISYSSDRVTINGEEQEYFIKDEDVSDNFYSLEKSMYQVISEEMMRNLSTAQEMSNLMGEAVERYRIQYKKLDQVRRLFFEDVEEDPDFDKFTDYFKWIDSSVSYMVSQMFPASVRFSKGISDVVESHLFERNKYQNKFPLTSTHTATEGRVKGVGELKYQWQFGHAPIEGGDNNNCLWQKERKERTDIPERESIREIIINDNNATSSNLANSNRTTYQGSTYARRRFTNTYRVGSSITQTVHSGINYNLQKNRDYIWSAVNRGSRLTSQGIPVNVLIVGAGTGQGIELPSSCDDVEIPNEKNKFNTTVYVGKNATSAGTGGSFNPINDSASYSYAIKGAHNLPFDIFSGSLTTGYNSAFASGFRSDAYVTNMHSDTTDFSNDVALQGPFANQWVGGHQSRHIDLNRHDATLRDDETGNAPPNNLHNQYTRAEGWLLRVVENDGGDSDGAFGIVDPQYGVTLATNKYPDAAKKSAVLYRDGRVKRALNISNIQTTTSSINHGNYRQNYEIISAGTGKQENNLYFRKNGTQSNYLPVSIINELPQTTNPMTLVGQQAASAGNVFGIYENNRQPDGQVIVPEVASAFASGSFVVTGAYTAGTSVGNATFRVYATGSQFKNNEGIKIVDGASNDKRFFFRTDTPPSDSDPNFYVATGSSNTDFWDNIETKIVAQTPFGVSYSEVTPGNTESLSLTSSVATPESAISTGSLPSQYTTNAFSFSGWIDITGSSDQTGDKMIFQFASSSADITRELLITTGGDLQYRSVSKGTVAGATCTRTQRIANYETTFQTRGSKHIVVSHDYGSGPGTVDFFIDGELVSSIESGAETLGGCTQTLTTIIPDGSGSLLNNNAMNKQFHGTGSNFVFWNIDLSPTHVDYIYNKGHYFDYSNALYCDLSIGNRIISWFPLAKESNAGTDSISGSNFSVEDDRNNFIDTNSGPSLLPYANFTLATSATGSDYNTTLTNSGFGSVATCGTVTNLSNGTGGTNYKGAYPNGSIVLDKTFIMAATATSPSIAIPQFTGGTNTAFWNALSQSIKDNTIYDDITVDSSAGHQAVFHLTASQTGSVHNKTITTSGANANLTFPGTEVGFAGGINFVSASLSKDITIDRITGSVTRTIITSRFSAPGSIDTLSYGFLDAYSQEYSVYNNLNYRNLSVRGVDVRVSASADGSDFYNFGGSGEAGTIRVNDHRNARDGMKALLSRHSGKFGIDPRYAAELGSEPLEQANPDPSFHKQQRNENRRPSDASTVLIPVLTTRNDNMYINTPIPRSDFQYTWVTSSLGSNYSITSGKQRMYGYAHPTGILSSSVVIDGDSGFVPAITFPTASEIFGV